ncbi:MAG: hypothetical protein IJZ88_04590 [Clostridia bacterium]|nr:hypothetical protein [Clostridia bacterium]
MRKALAIVLCLILALLTGCSTKLSDSNKPSEQEQTLPEKVELLRQFPKGVFAKTVTVPYRNVKSVDISGNLLYLSVYDRYEAIGTDMLVSYDINTCDERILFELPYNSNYDDCFIQGVQTDGKWLLWEVCNIMSGHFNSIYVMNLENREISIAKEMSDLNSTSPAYGNGKVLWCETDSEKSTVFVYDCLSEKTEKICDIDSRINSLATDGNKAVWYADGGYTVYDLTDSETEEIKTDTQSVNSLAVKDNKIFSACDNHIVITDIESKQTEKIEQIADDLFITDDYIVGKYSQVTNFYYRNKLTENENLLRYYVEALGTDGNRLVTVTENEGKYANDDGTLIEQVWVHIYDFDKLTEVE